VAIQTLDRSYILSSFLTAHYPVLSQSLSGGVPYEYKMTLAVHEFAASRQRRVPILNPNDIHECTKKKKETEFKRK
jgi:hypothetical protein